MKNLGLNELVKPVPLHSPRVNTHALHLSSFFDTQVKRIPDKWLSQFVYWSKYFVECLVSGDVIFREVQHAEPDITLVRLSPPTSPVIALLFIDQSHHLKIYHFLRTNLTSLLQ